MEKKKRIYSLYSNEKETRLEISSSVCLWSNEINNNSIKEGEIYRYNSNMYLSFSRALLVKKAKEIKEQWYQNTIAFAEKIKGMEIK